MRNSELYDLSKIMIKIGGVLIVVNALVTLILNNQIFCILPMIGLVVAVAGEIGLIINYQITKD